MKQRIAIDPGVGGGMVYEDTGDVMGFPMPSTLGDLVRTMRILCADKPDVYIEELPKWQGKMSASSMGVMFQNYGQLLGIIKTLDCRIVMIKPQAWQKALGLGDKKAHGKKWKTHLKARAQEFYPTHEITLKTADAFLIYEASLRLFPRQ
jgi:hypothetical protein